MTRFRNRYIRRSLASRFLACFVWLRLLLPNRMRLTVPLLRYLRLVCRQSIPETLADGLVSRSKAQRHSLPALPFVPVLHKLPKARSTVVLIACEASYG
jgi:hypothetical protein